MGRGTMPYKTHIVQEQGLRFLEDFQVTDAKFQQSYFVNLDIMLHPNCALIQCLELRIYFKG